MSVVLPVFVTEPSRTAATEPAAGGQRLRQRAVHVQLQRVPDCHTTSMTLLLVPPRILVHVALAVSCLPGSALAAY